MNTGYVWVKKAHSWQVYQKENRTKMNNKDKTPNYEWWFATEQEAQEKLKELREQVKE